MEKQHQTGAALSSHHHYRSVPFPLTQQELTKKAEAFLQFLSLPREVKRKLHFSVEKARGSADGYTEKLDVPDKDRKEFFHWRPELAEKEICKELCAEHEAVRTFFAIAESLFRQTSSVAHDTFLEFFPEYIDRLFDHTAAGPMPRSAVLRFLSYEPTAVDAFCAKGHFDKGFCTLALAESAPGLRVGSENADLHLVEHTDNAALFMPGMMFYEASDGAIKPVWHDVVHSAGAPRVNEFCARWAIVYFIELPDLSFSSWERVHLPFQ